MTTFEDDVRAAVRAIAAHAPQMDGPDRQRLARQTGPRRRPLAIAAAAAVVVAVSSVALWSSTRGSHVQRVNVMPASPALQSSIMPASPLSARIGMASVWTGSEWLIWGGHDTANRPLEDGASFDPTDARWSELPQAPLTGRASPVSVWTGHAWIIYGGTADSALLDGAAFSSQTRSWKLLPPSPAVLHDTSNAPIEGTWTGTEMVVVADTGAAAYNPSTNKWTVLPSVPGQSAFVTTGQAVWTGEQAIFLLAPQQAGAPPSGTSGTESSAPGGPVPVAPRGAFALGAYSPRTNTWSLLPPGGYGADIEPRLVWTGTMLLAIDQWSATVASPSNNQATGSTSTGTSAAYDPATRRWSPLPKLSPATGGGHGVTTPQWTGSSVLLWDGGPTGSAYSPATDTDMTFSTSSDRRLFDPAVAWTGRELLVWGAVSGGDAPSGTAAGATYEPPSG